MLAKILQVSKMLVPDRKCGPQISLCLPAGRIMTTYQKTVTESVELFIVNSVDFV